ncbi:MAG: hypothetical protein ACT4SY_02125 [Hyphomicrobiales bacterium]
MQSDKSKPGGAVKPGVRVNAAVLAGAIWRATVPDEKTLVDLQQRQAQWQADRERYLDLGRKVMQQLRAMRRERRAAGKEKQ